MAETIQLLQSPFVIRIILGGSLLAFVFGLMGYFVSLKKSYFYGEVIAHSSLEGIAIGLFWGVSPLPVAFGYALIIALLLPQLERITRLDVNNVLAIILPFSMGLGVLIFSQIPGYQANLTSFLFGSMVWIGWSEIWSFLGLALLLSGVLTFTSQKLTMVNLDREYSELLGINVRVYEIVYNFFLALIIIIGVRLAGVVLINAFLIIPATISKILSGSLRTMYFLTPIVAVLSVVSGIFISILFNIPSGASISVVLGGIFFCVAIFKSALLKKNSHN
jgi:ABC-type Mn2+/Zn2+ transport system permease subunit